MGKIPYIEDYQNKKFYGGNYYDVLKRDNYCCVNCGSTSNLNVHHIIGMRYDDNSCFSINSLITLCRRCHSKEHAKPYSIVTKDILENIKFDLNMYNEIEMISNNSGRKKLNEVYK
jgi:5-methylcytosine-specific restriction endonuclease McrA